MDARAAAAALAALVRFPTVSAAPDPRAFAGCARWLADWMRRIGFRVSVEAPARGAPPIILGTWSAARAAPTLLIYNHYDVQPAGADRAWEHAPFAGTIAPGVVVGRGSADNKSQIAALLLTCERVSRGPGRPPVNLCCLFDGEEEIGSPHLGRYLAARAPELRADAAVISDSLMQDERTPALTVSLRGMLSLEVTAARGGRVAHAGTCGGRLPDPLAGLARALGAAFDARGRVVVPGFSAGVAVDESTTARSPSLTITGWSGGAVSAGPSSSIATRALARLDARVAPGQTTSAVERALRAHFTRMTTPGVRLDVRRLAAAAPIEVDVGHPLVAAARAALTAAYGRAPALVRSGGSIPAAALLAALGLPLVLLGCVPPSARIHAPDEHMPIAALLAASRVFLELLRRARPALSRSGRAAATNPFAPGATA